MYLTHLADDVAELNAERTGIDVGFDIAFRDIGSGKTVDGIVVGVAPGGYEVLSRRGGRRELFVAEQDVLAVKRGSAE